MSFSQCVRLRSGSVLATLNESRTAHGWTGDGIRWLVISIWTTLLTSIYLIYLSINMLHNTLRAVIVNSPTGVNYALKLVTAWMDDYWLRMNQGAVIFYRWCQNEQVHWLFSPDPDLLVVPVSWSPTPCFVLDFLALIYRQHIDKAPLKEGEICIERLLKHCCHSRPVLTVLLSDKVLAPWTHITRRCNHRDVWKKK